MILCGASNPLVQNVILNVEPDSTVTVTPVASQGLPPFSSSLVGFVDSTATIQLSLLDIALKRTVSGTVEINQLLIAGTPATILGLSTGTICTAIDPDAPPPTGSVTIDILREQMRLQATASTIISPTDPVTRSFLHDVLDIDYLVELDETTRVTAVDLVGALTGKPIPVDIVVPVDFFVPITNLLLANAHVTGQIHMKSVEAIPTSPLLDDCVAFYGM
jgi:hypothetical protein